MLAAMQASKLTLSTDCSDQSGEGDAAAPEALDEGHFIDNEQERMAE